MSNMSYCRFENTVQDLRDCYENWESLVEKETDEESPNEHELRARATMLKICQNIVDNYGGES